MTFILNNNNNDNNNNKRGRNATAVLFKGLACNGLIAYEWPCEIRYLQEAQLLHRGRTMFHVVKSLLSTRGHTKSHR